MNVLVTGSSGLVGSSLIKRLLNKGFSVVGYDQSQPKNYSEGCRYEQGDLCDFPHLASIIQKYKVDSIVHCGGFSHPQVGAESPYQIVQTNIIGTTNVFEAARLFKIKRVVYLSSGAVYGNSKAKLMKEDDKLNPTTIYGVSKMTGEQLARVFTTKHGVEIISLRIAFVYGPNRSMPGPIKSYLERAVDGKNIKEKTGADQELEFIYVKDVARAIELALNTHGLSNTIFNIGSGVNSTMEEVKQIICRLFPKLSVEIGKGDLGYKITEPFDCSRANEELNFQTHYSLEEGIKDYLNILQHQKK